MQKGHLHMLTNNKTQKGFTIIEVLIVLAIAGLIMLIVFLAVPALQRNSRNTERRSDVSRVLGATQEVINNNNGSLAALTAANLNAAVGTLGYYQSANVTVTGAGAATNNTTVDQVQIRTGASCAAPGAANFGSAIPGTARQIAVMYTIEPLVRQCTSS